MRFDEFFKLDTLLHAYYKGSANNYLLSEQIDLLALLLAGVAKNTDNIIAKHMATSSLAAHARGGETPLESTAVMDAPLVSRVSTTSIIPKGAAKCKGLKIDNKNSY